jgi:hypothetical protein
VAVSPVSVRCQRLRAREGAELTEDLAHLMIDVRRPAVVEQAPLLNGLGLDAFTFTQDGVTREIDLGCCRRAAVADAGPAPAHNLTQPAPTPSLAVIIWARGAVQLPGNDVAGEVVQHGGDRTTPSQ